MRWDYSPSKYSRNVQDKKERSPGQSSNTVTLGRSSVFSSVDQEGKKGLAGPCLPTPVLWGSGSAAGSGRDGLTGLFG